MYLVIASLIASTQAITCIQQPDPLNTYSKIQIDCSHSNNALSRLRYTNGTNSSSIDNSSAPASFSDLASPLTTILNLPPLPSVVNGNLTNMFTFDVICTRGTPQETCLKANATLIQAGQFISNVIDLETEIRVNVTMFPFCQSAMICSDGTDSLAAAAPARTISLLDDDNVQRLYPQSVVKQFAPYLSSIPTFSEYDINMNINSEALFYYTDSALPINSTQTDLLFVVLHELFHGLGFTSSYEDYFHPTSPSTVTPNVLISGADQNISFAGFIEYAFDKYLKLESGFVTNLVSTMNARLLTLTNNRTYSPAGLGTTFESDPVSEISRSLTRNFTTAHTTSYSYNQSLVTLETGIPFSSGSSISHMSSDIYAGTSDFLMRYISQRGVTLQQLQDKEYGAIGPGLRGVMASLGYRVRALQPQTSGAHRVSPFWLVITAITLLL